MWIINGLLAVLRAAFADAGLAATHAAAAAGYFVALIVIVFIAAQPLVVDSALLFAWN